MRIKKKKNRIIIGKAEKWNEYDEKKAIQKYQQRRGILELPQVLAK